MMVGNEKIPEGMEDIATLVMELLETCSKHEVQLSIRGLSSTLSMIVVNSAPSREDAENLIESLANTILDIIEMMDEAGMAGWNEGEGHTLQ